MSKTTEEWTEGLSEKGIEFYHKIESIGSGELKGYGELSASSWAASRQRDVLYKKDGLEFELPLHRVMSNDDKYACVDNEFGLGLIEHALNDESRRVYKCALRELRWGSTRRACPSAMWRRWRTGRRCSCTSPTSRSRRTSSASSSSACASS